MESQRAFTVVRMEPEHVSQVVEVHVHSFPSFFLTFLGPRFLQLLYREILREDGHVSLIALDGSQRIAGFVAGVLNQSGFYGRLARRRWFSFGLASLGAILRKPSILPRLLRAFRRSKDSKEATSPALLMSLAVLPDFQGHGIGQALVFALLKEMKRMGADSVVLTTDRDGNKGVNVFYQRIGFALARQFSTPEGRNMNEYVFRLSQLAEQES